MSSETAQLCGSTRRCQTLHRQRVDRKLCRVLQEQDHGFEQVSHRICVWALSGLMYLKNWQEYVVFIIGCINVLVFVNSYDKKIHWSIVWVFIFSGQIFTYCWLLFPSWIVLDQAICLCVCLSLVCFEALTIPVNWAIQGTAFIFIIPTLCMSHFQVTNMFTSTWPCDPGCLQGVMVSHLVFYSVKEQGNS